MSLHVQSDRPAVVEPRGDAEEVLLHHALAVRMVLSRMEEAIRLGADEHVVPDVDDLWEHPAPAG